MTVTAPSRTRPDLLTHGPGLGGYVLALAVSAAVYTAFLCTFFGFSPFVFGAVYPIVFSVVVPVGGAGVLLVEMSCWHERRQWVHVLAAACSAYVITLAVLGFFAVVTFSAPGPELVTVAATAATPMAVSAAVGRAAVIPLVHRRRSGP